MLRQRVSWLTLLGAATILAAAQSAAQGVAPCPAGTQQLDPNFNVCVLTPPAVACPAGTAPAFPGSDICILDPLSIPKYVDNLVIPPEMPSSGTVNGVKYYEIAVRQFPQQILPAPLPATTVWSYGRATDPLPALAPDPAVSSFNYPAFTVENLADTPTRVKWINGLVDGAGQPLKHLLPVDQTLHWANPPMQCMSGAPGTDCMGMSQAPYLGPVPIIPHVHGAHVGPESDGYPEAWWLPAGNIPPGYATQGSLYDQYDRTNTTPGTAVFQYPNTQPPSTLWYHDHTLGMTRANVYAGPAGFWMVRGAAEPAGLPGPAPRIGDAGGPYYEIPIVIQDRSFNPDGSLFYPPARSFFEGVGASAANFQGVAQLSIPFIPSLTLDGMMSDVPPIWNPEAFFTTMVVNGRTWPAFHVEPRRYRLRLLNGCNSRFLNLSLVDQGTNTEIPFYQIAAEGGYLPNVVRVSTGESTLLPGDGTEPATPTLASDPARALLVGLAERADVIVDFTGMQGKTILMTNTAPDAPFGGFPALPLADPNTTGQVMQLVVDVALNGADASLAPKDLVLTPPALLPATALAPRRLSVNEMDSATVCVLADAATGAFVVPITEVSCTTAVPPPGQIVVPFGPAMALLGTLDAAGNAVALRWMDPITENPRQGNVEEWWIHNFTMDAHPIHLHLVQFEVLSRQNLLLDAMGMPVQPVQVTGPIFPAEPTELGRKDTVIVYPGTVTKIKAHFDMAGLYVWHCHILEHEDNEMMRPYFVTATHTLTVVANPPAGGTVTGGGTYDVGKVVKLTATPAAGYRFVNWTGAYFGTTNPVNVTASADKSYTANFAPIGSFFITTRTSPVSGAGTLTGGGVYAPGKVAVLTAVPAPGYTFIGWKEYPATLANPLRVTANADKTVTARFAQPYTISVASNPAEGGSVTGGGTYVPLSQVTLTAVPAPGYRFARWSGSYTGTSNPLEFTATGNKSITAVFAFQYTISTGASPLAGGTVTGGGTYDAGKVVTVTATPNAGYRFTGWTGSYNGTTNPVKITANADKTLTAMFDDDDALTRR